jgi:hypothetical protein
MKSIYFLTFSVLLCSVARAQIAKGDIMLGGDIYYYNSGSTSSSSGTPTYTYTNKSTNVGINPSFGKAIKDNLVLGVDITYNHYTNGDNSNNNSPDYNTNSNSFGAGVFIRQYKPLGNGFYLFGQAELNGSYSSGKLDNPGTTSGYTKDDTKGYGFSLRLYPGVAYALNRRWQLETELTGFFALTYNHSKETSDYVGQPEENSNTHNFNVSSSLTGGNAFTLGVRYWIPG